MDNAGIPMETVLDEIPREDCIELLKTQTVGRLAVADHGYYPPHIVPVNFVVEGDNVVFRSNPGLKFKLSVLAEHSVSFEADQVSEVGHMAWSVVVQGKAELLTEEQVNALPHHEWLRPWAPGEREQWVRIEPYTITGRRIRTVPVSPPSGA